MNDQLSPEAVIGAISAVIALVALGLAAVQVELSRRTLKATTRPAIDRHTAELVDTVVEGRRSAEVKAAANLLLDLVVACGRCEPGVPDVVATDARRITDDAIAELRRFAASYHSLNHGLAVSKLRQFVDEEVTAYCQTAVCPATGAHCRYLLA